MFQDAAIFTFMIIIAGLFVMYGIKICMILADVVQMLISIFMPYMEEEIEKGKNNERLKRGPQALFFLFSYSTKFRFFGTIC